LLSVVLKFLFFEPHLVTATVVAQPREPLGRHDADDVREAALPTAAALLPIEQTQPVRRPDRVLRRAPAHPCPRRDRVDMQQDEDGKPKRGEGGVQGFIEWLAMYEPKTAAALFARVLPYFINVGGEVPEVVSEAEMEAMLKELGLPIGLIEHMQTAPAPLDLDENPDPYGMKAEAAAKVEAAAKGVSDGTAE